VGFRKGMTVLSFWSETHRETHRETPVDLFVTDPFEFEAEYAAATLGEITPGVQVRFVSLVNW